MVRYRGGQGTVTVRLQDPRPAGGDWEPEVVAWRKRRGQAWAAAADAAGADELTVIRLLVEHGPNQLRCREMPGGGVWMTDYDLAELRRFVFADENGNVVRL